MGAVLVLVVGGLAYLLWDNWWVNWDGGFYLYLGRSLRLGDGMTFPDGSPATFRGPGYPALFAAGWSFLDISAKSAIWMSRSLLLAAGATIAAMVISAAGSKTWGVIAGLAAVLPALVLHSGGWIFVPDGMAAVLVLLAMGVALVGRGESSFRGVAVGLLMAGAVLTKETALLYAPIVPLVSWVRAGSLKPRERVFAGTYVLVFGLVLLAWFWWAVSVTDARDLRALPLPVGIAAAVLVGTVVVGIVLILTRHLGDVLPSPRAWLVGTVSAPIAVLGTFATLWFVGEPVVYSVWEGLTQAAEDLAFLYGWAWVPGVVLMGLGLVAIARLPRALTPLWLAGLLLVSVGIGQAWYSGAAALTMRNAVGGAFGFALLIGIGAGALTRVNTSSLRRPLRLITPGLALAFILLASLATYRIDTDQPGIAASWDNPAVHEINEWLNNSSYSTVVTTPFYATYVWFLGGDLPTPELMGQYLAAQGREQYERSDFCRQLWWAGDVSACPPESELRVAMANRRVISTTFVGSIPQETDVLLVSGNAYSSSANNGSGLLYLMEEFDIGEVVFATREVHLPHWAVAYEINLDQWSSDDLPAVVEPGIDGLDNLAGHVLPLDNQRLLELLREVLP